MNKVKIGVWKTYPEFPFIEVNTFGGVRTLDRMVPCGKGTRLEKGHILKQFDNGHGYLFVSFSMHGKQVTRYVHRLVAQTFIPNPDNFTEVNHKDNNPTNNCVINLEWCTHEYNMQYKEKYGVSYKEAAQKKPLFAVNLDTLEVSRFSSQSEASRELKINQGNIGSVIKYRLSQTKGYWFTNADSNAVEATKAKFGNVVAGHVEELMNELQPA